MDKHIEPLIVCGTLVLCFSVVQHRVYVRNLGGDEVSVQFWGCWNGCQLRSLTYGLLYVEGRIRLCGAVLIFRRFKNSVLFSESAFQELIMTVKLSLLTALCNQRNFKSFDIKLKLVCSKNHLLIRYSKKQPFQNNHRGKNGATMSRELCLNLTGGHRSPPPRQHKHTTVVWLAWEEWGAFLIAFNMIFPLILWSANHLNVLNHLCNAETLSSVCCVFCSSQCDDVERWRRLFWRFTFLSATLKCLL